MKYFLIVLMVGVYSLCISRPVVEFKADTVNGLSPALSRLIDSLKCALSSANSNDKFDIKFALFREYLKVNRDSALAYVERSYSEAIQNGDSICIIKSLNGKGYVLKDQGDLPAAIRSFEIGLEMARRNNFKKQIIFILNNLASTHLLSSSYDKALKYYLESLKIREQENNPIEMSVALNNIGVVYDELGDFENALLYFEKSYKVKIDNNVDYDRERTLTNIVLALIDLGKIEEANEKVTQVFEMCEKSRCEPDLLSEAYGALGSVMLNQRKFVSAEEYFKRSLKISDLIELPNRSSLHLYQLALLKYQVGKQEEAMVYLNKSQEKALKSGLQKIVLNNFLLYRKIYSSLAMYKAALKYQDLYYELNSKILNAEMIRKISKIQSDHEERENNNKIISQARMLTILEESIRRQKISNVLIGTVALLTMGLVFVLFRVNRQKQQINRLLDLRVQDRTFELEKNRDMLQHSYDEQIIVLDRAYNHLLASLATLKGLSAIAIKDLPEGQHIYFNEAVRTTESMVSYLKKCTDYQVKL